MLAAESRQSPIPRAPLPDPDSRKTDDRPTRLICGPLVRAGSGRPPLPAVAGYEILAPIGAGGMGIVVKARHLGLDRIVALKMLGRDADDPTSHRRFQLEAEAVARLQHPNIIQVFDVGMFDAGPAGWTAQPYISFEFVEGGSLAKHTLSPQDPRWAGRMVETLARAVAAAHQVGVIHRDLKPGNVLLTADGVPKIADFGLAKHLEPGKSADGRFLTQAGALVGTPEYMAPEQIDGADPTPAIDIYALGVLLYELLTGHVPFKAGTVPETFLLVKYQEPVPPRRLQPNLARDLETICLTCLAKDPRKRYASAEALADDLARWAEGRPIKARAVGSVEQLGRWAKRNPTVAGLSLATLLTAVVGVSAVVWNWQEARRAAADARAAAAAAEASNLEKDWEYYRATVWIASSALQLNNSNVARGALQKAPEGLRDWEWHYLSRRLDTPHTVVRTLDPDSQIARICPETYLIQVHTHGKSQELWDPLTGRSLATLPVPAPGGHLRFSPDGRYGAIHTGSGSVRITDVAGGGPPVTLTGHTDEVWGTEFGRGCGRVVTASRDGTNRVWDLGTGREVSAFRGHAVISRVLDLSPDGRRVVTWEGETPSLVLWDADTGQTVRPLVGHTKALNGGMFSPDGTRLLTVEQFPGIEMRLWDGRTGEPVETLSGQRNQITCFRFSPDGKWIATSSRDQTIQLWDGKSGKPRAILKGHTGWVNQLAFSPDGARLVSGAQDQTVRVWDMAGTEVAVLRGHTGDVIDVAFGPTEADVLSVSADGTIRRWDTRGAEADGMLRGHQSYVYGVAWHPDGRRVASASWDGTVRVWDAVTGTEIKVLHTGDGAITSSVAFHPSGKLLASIGRDDRIRLWDTGTWETVHSWYHPTKDWQDTRIAFSPAGDRLAAGSCLGDVHVFDVNARTEPVVLRGHSNAVRDVAFSPDGRFLASVGTFGDETVRVWDVAARSEVAVLRGHKHAVYCVAFSPDGRTLASGAVDATVRLWDTETWDQAAILPHGSNVYGLAFTPDGMRLACGCADNTIRLWDVARRQEVLELRGHGDYVHAVAFSPDGRTCVSGSGDFTVRLWETTPTKP